MGSTLEATLRAELTQLENRRAIVEDALDRLAVLNGAEDSPPAEPQREERGPRRRDEKKDYGWSHPTLGRIPISREHPHFERLWKDDMERTLAALKEEQGGQSLTQLAPQLNLTGGYLSGILRFMEAEGTVEAVNPAHRLRTHVPNKLYRVTAAPASPSGEEETEGRRKSGTNEVAALRFIEENPDTSATALAEHLDVGVRYARQVLTKLEAKGSLTSRKIGRERHYRVGESALPVPAADVPKRAAPKPKRRRGKRRKRGEGSKLVFTYVSENPGANTAEIVEATGLQYDWGYNVCRQLEHAGRIRKELPENRKLPARWYPAVQDPVRPQPADKPQREVRTIPGQGVELGRLKGTSLGGAS